MGWLIEPAHDMKKTPAFIKLYNGIESLHHIWRADLTLLGNQKDKI